MTVHGHGCHVWQGHVCVTFVLIGSVNGHFGGWVVENRIEVTIAGSLGRYQTTPLAPSQLIGQYVSRICRVLVI